MSAAICNQKSLAFTTSEQSNTPHISPRRGIRRSKNPGEYIRLADKELKDRWGTKRYVSAARCPECGTKNLRRTQAGVCLACCMKETK
jgi:hypothetical protein